MILQGLAVHKKIEPLFEAINTLKWNLECTVKWLHPSIVSSTLYRHWLALLSEDKQKNFNSLDPVSPRLLTNSSYLFAVKLF